jgi:leader peptidase (prepilin peptidase)/N-methyltransferase
MNTNGFLVTSGFLTSGLLAGHAARRLLARLRRGAVFRPPGCELFAAMASVIVGWRFAVGALPVWWFAVPLLLGWLAVPLAAVDLSVLRLPNVLTYAAYPILGGTLTVAATCGPDHSLAARALLGTVVLGGTHVVARRLVPAALGAGDAKLAGSLGAVLGALGWQSLILATALAATITLALALTPLARPQPTRAHSPSPQPNPPPPTHPKECPSATPPGPTPPRIPLLRRAVPHGPGLLIATWLLATFPGQALIGGATG